MAKTKRIQLHVTYPAPRAASASSTTTLLVVVLAAVALALVASMPARASAQRRFSVDVRGGSGASIGGGDGQATVRHTPVYIEAGVHSWLDEESSVVLGGSVRVEVEDRASIGGVLRAGLRARFDVLELRPSIGIAAILAPYTLVGPEAGLMALIAIAPPVSLVLHLAVDGWLFGSDLAPSTVLVMVNGALGVEVSI